jgi:hypothetical protein
MEISRGAACELSPANIRLACDAIALGLIEAFALPDTRAMSFFELGVGLLIAHPIIRVMSMLAYLVSQTPP